MANETQHGSTTGKFDLSVFDQDSRWFDQEGAVFLIADMSTDERDSLIAWLHSHVRFFYLQTLARDLLPMWAQDRTPTVGNVPNMLFISAEEWMDRTPLLRRLAEHPSPRHRPDAS